MRDRAQALAAIAGLNGKELAGQVLKVNEAKPRETRTGHGRDREGGGFGSGGRSGRPGGGYGSKGVEEASTTAKAEPTIVEAIEAEGSEARVREVDREAAEARVPVDSPGLRRHGEGPRMK